jgi:hypothetical protein
MRGAPAEHGCTGHRMPHLRAAQGALGAERGRRSVRRGRTDAADADRTRFRRVDIWCALAGTMHRPDVIGSGPWSWQADRIPCRCSDCRCRSHQRVRNCCRGLRSGKGFSLHRRGWGCVLRKTGARCRCENGDRRCRRSEPVHVDLQNGDHSVALTQVEARSCSLSLMSGCGCRPQSMIMLITAGTMTSSRIGPISMPPTTTVASGR